jgi:glucose/arabinose dehydrogenase
MFRRSETDRRRASLGVVAIVLGGLLIGCVGPRDATTVHVAATALPPPIATPIALLPPSPDVELSPTAAAATATATQTAVPVLPTETPIDLPATPLLSLEVPSFKLAPVADGLDRPLFVTHGDDGSGRLFIVEKSGTVRILTEGRLVERPFLDIRDRIGSGGSEQGLLGLAFAPDYDRTGHFYVNYTDRRGDTVVARYQVSEDIGLADPASETVVLKLGQPAGNHNGGMLAFGPDGLLWIGTGDGGGANDRYGNGQNPGTLLGKMLRLDVTSDPGQAYTMPTDNPWVNSDWSGQDVRDEVWAVGLRNPWRYSFDRNTGDLWIADVGQNRYEEINLVPAGSPGGLNFGWPIAEGAHCFPEDKPCDRRGQERPIFDYPHEEGNCSITGGYVYRGTQMPALDGAYIFGDFCSGRIWALAREGAGWKSLEMLDTNLSLSSFGEDEAGELYVTDLNRGGVYLLAPE